MRMAFGTLSLLVVVAIMGVLAKKQLGAVSAAPTPAAVSGAGDVAVPTGTPKQQVEQFKQAAEAAMQQARPMPSDDK